MTGAADPGLLFLFVAANLAITAGYAFVAFAVVPKIAIQLLRTKLGGVGFFFLCGMTHLDMAFHALFRSDEPFSHMSTSWHMLAIHIPQAICVWLFVTGVYIEMGDFGLLRMKDREPEASVDDPPAT